MPDSEPIRALHGRQSTQSREFALARRAGRQFGAVSREQLLALGFTAKEVSGMVQRGLLHPLYAGVCAVGHTRIVGHARLIGALLSCGTASFLSHRTAAAVHGLRQENASRIEVTVPGARAPVRHELIVHRTAHRPHPLEVVVRNGLRVSRPRPKRKSGLERAFDALIAGTEIPPPLRNVIVEGWELDCYWPEHRLAVELDGRPYHVAVRDIERDKHKDAKLLRLGIAVMRITDLRLELEPQAVLADVRALTT